MPATYNIFRKIGQGLAALAIFAAAPVAAQEDVISNTARAQWSVAGNEQQTTSNNVSFMVLNAESNMQTYVPMPGSNLVFNLDHQFCGSATAAGGASAANASGVGDSSSTPVIPANRIRPGQLLIVRVDSTLANIDPGRPETLDLVVRSQSGDIEHIVAYETGPDTASFVASLQTEQARASVIRDNCVLSIEDDDHLRIEANAENSTTILSGEVDALADPYGMIFDSRNGMPVEGARVTLIDDETGQPARVFAPDGVTPYPSSVISGQGARDAAGTFYPVNAGEYWFPLTAFGSYRLVVEPPQPYTAPSVASPEMFAQMRRPGGGAFDISDGSYGRVFHIVGVDPLRFDIPVDAPGGTVTVDKSASIEQAAPGEAAFYRITVRNRDQNFPTTPLTLTDSASASMRLEPNSVRVNGAEPSSGLSVSATGHGFSLQLDSLAPGARVDVSYAMRVREDAAPGYAENRATVETRDGAPVTGNAVVRIVRDQLTGRMTIIGRVAGGTCGPRGEAPGIAGVRVMLEDGSYAITDKDGRYHFEGVVPGSHVVRLVETTLPEGVKLTDCGGSARSAGSLNSRFLRGYGGALARADFTVAISAEALAARDHAANDETGAANGPAQNVGPNNAGPNKAVLASQAQPSRTPLSDKEASGATTDWLALGNGDNGFLFPATDHNPRSPLIRVVVRHRADQKVDLLANGTEVNSLSFDSRKVNAEQGYAVSIWRAVAIEDGLTNLTAILRNANGAEAERFTRTVRYAGAPAKAELIAEHSKLVADGNSKPVLAIRFTDRSGAPVTSGMTGSILIDSPYRLASDLDTRRNQTLSGERSTSANWRVNGDDGIAYIELAPTMVSGSLRASFTFTNGELQREQEIEAWLRPGDQPWTVVGLGEVKLGAGSIARDMERERGFDSDLGEDARVALYAKGQILGSALLTLAYDSAKQKPDQRLLGSLNPSAYYTVYADGAERLYDAASREKLYIRIETAQFYAVYGDFETGFNQTDLGRYNRSATGVKAEGRFGQLQASAYAAKVGTRQRRDEIQGSGITGPYSLSSRNIVANSDRVFVEVRDRLRSDIILETRELQRFVDYNIDLLSATITFAQPLQSRNGQLNPQFAIVNYEVDDLGKGEWNGGARVAWSNDSGNVRLGASAISDKGDNARTNLGAVDARVRLGNKTEIRAEAGASRTDGENATAVQLEVEHNDANLNVLAYARQIDRDYGVGQQNVADRGLRKYGVDAQYRVSDNISFAGRAWREEALDSAARRTASELRANWHGKSNDGFISLARLRDQLADGRSLTTSLVELGGSQRLLNNKLELNGAVSIPIGTAEANALPARYRAGARYTLTGDVKLFGTYEYATGDQFKARTFEAGVEVAPWAGARVATSLGSQSLASDQSRTYAAYSLGQSLSPFEGLTVDASVDGNYTLGGSIGVNDVFNPNYPLPSGGNIGNNGSLGEDFVSYSLGLSYARALWNARLRAEFLNGEFANRRGIRATAIRTLGEGSVLGGGFSWTRAASGEGQTSEAYNAALSFAYRPANDVFAVLGKLEYRGDEVTGAVAGQAGPAGQTALLVDGDARLRRLMASASFNWTPRSGTLAGSELNLFGAARYNFDQLAAYSLGTTSLLGGGDWRFRINDYIDLGARGTLRYNLDSGTMNYSFGPEIAVSPVENVQIAIGYNVVGFKDPDYSAAHSTDKGFCVTLRFKFDEHLLDIVR